MQTSNQQSLSVIESDSSVAALLSPLRRQILEELHQEADSATGLARKLSLPRQKVNYHVRTLQREGFLELAGQEKRRGCIERRFRPIARTYLISPDLTGSLGMEAAELRDRFSSAYLITLAARMVRDVAQLRQGARKASQPLATFALEVDVNFATPAERTAFAEKFTETVAALVARYQSDAAGSRPYRFVVGGHPVARSPKKKGDDSHVKHQH